MTVTQPARRDAEAIAERLLRASAEHSFDPMTEIDWAAPPVEGLRYLPEHRVSLYGTALWEQMSEQQRIDLSRHEVASLASMGIWFELILMQMLVRHVFDQSPTTRHVQYALTEIADECRHSVMFGRLVETLGTPAYRPDPLAHNLGRLMKTIASTPEVFAGALIAEELLDRLQREMIADESVQPLVRAVSRIHVIEEARHVRYAREALSRSAARLSGAQLRAVRLSVAWSAHVISTRLIHPDVYANVGLDRQLAVAAARANPAHRETLRWSAERLVTFFREVGLIGGPSARIWRRAALI